MKHKKMKRAIGEQTLWIFDQLKAQWNKRIRSRTGGHKINPAWVNAPYQELHMDLITGEQTIKIKPDKNKIKGPHVDRFVFNDKTKTYQKEKPCLG